jgi:lipoprotein-anchoring transpeptidase ErfK/SrfK
MTRDRANRRARLRLVAGLVFLLGLLAYPAGATAQGTSPCRFILGFAAMAERIPTQVGRCVENEWHDPTSGDARQRTTGGLLVWRKADNLVAFTDGATTWVAGPDGLQQRPNGQRFAWEANPEGLPPVSVPDVRPVATSSGRTIVIQLGSQSLTAYDRGVVVLATPITTGRPELPTPVGEGAVFRRASPYLFISPWPLGDSYCYAPSWVNWALEFYGGGCFIHDAPWQPAGTYGPGSDYGPYASHGCVHVPSGAMRSLYQWATNDTPVIVTR